MAAITSFRFDDAAHEYLDTATGEVLPHITGMLDRTGWIDDRWYTEESCERGRQVHSLTAAYDLGAIADPRAEVSKYKGWLLAHVKAMNTIAPRPEIHAVEEPSVHPTLHFGGQPDRRGLYYRLRGVLEIKSGGPERSHQIQTALQAILEAPKYGIPPEAMIRLCLYLKDNGKFKLEEHKARRDFDEARRVIRVCCDR